MGSGKLPKALRPNKIPRQRPPLIPRIKRRARNVRSPRIRLKQNASSVSEMQSSAKKQPVKRNSGALNWRF
jgi:hypothetical protein